MTAIEELFGESLYFSQKKSRDLNYDLLCEILYYMENNSKKKYLN